MDQNKNFLRDKRDTVEWIYSDFITSEIIKKFHPIDLSDEGSNPKTYTYFSKLLGKTISVETNTFSTLCGNCAYKQICSKYSKLVEEEIGGTCSPFIKYSAISEQYSVEELYQQLDEINDAPISEEEKRNNMRLLIMIEYEKHKREN